MGQVYQATDTQLNRQVALKVLPDAFAADPERLARFTREAQILASLNHPNIAAIHGIEEGENTRALVLELVEGPTLADRIKQGPNPKRHSDALLSTSLRGTRLKGQRDSFRMRMYARSLLGLLTGRDWSMPPTSWGRHQLYLRALDEQEPQPTAETEFA